jgi:RNA polymerase sigma factor (sigma-70 family)
MGGALLVRPVEATDAELLEQVRAGDRDAYGRLWERHEPDARAFARFLTHSGDEADDVVAEAFAKVLRAIHGGHGPTESFRPYLITAIRRTWWRRSDRQPRETSFEDEATFRTLGEVDELPWDDEFDGEVARAFQRLTPRWQRVLWSAEVQGRTSAEIGAELGLSPNAAAALIGRAREGLRRTYLLESGGTPVTVAA